MLIRIKKKMWYWNKYYLKDRVLDYMYKPPSVVIDNVTSKIHRFYKSIMELTSKQEELILSATEYVSYVLPTEYRHCRHIVEALSLWLSLHWIIAESDTDLLKASLIIDKLVRKDDIKTSLDTPILKLTYAVYKRYLELIDAYRQNSADAFAKVVYWSTNSLQVYPKDVSYHQWTLATNPIMGMIWNILLVTHTPIAVYTKYIKMTALIICYHQDLLRFKQDLCKDNYNIVKLMTNDNYLQGYDHTVKLIEYMYMQVKMALKNNLTMALRIMQILEGSYRWICIQSEYQHGLTLLQAAQNNDSAKFYQKLAQN